MQENNRIEFITPPQGTVFPEEAPVPPVVSNKSHIHLLTIYVSEDGISACERMLTSWAPEVPLSILIIARRSEHLDRIDSSLKVLAPTSTATHAIGQDGEDDLERKRFVPIRVTKTTQISKGNVYLISTELHIRFKENTLFVSEKAIPDQEQDAVKSGYVFFCSLTRSLRHKTIVLLFTSAIEDIIEILKDVRSQHGLLLHHSDSATLGQNNQHLHPILYLLDKSTSLETVAEQTQLYIESLDNGDLQQLSNEPSYKDGIKTLIDRLAILSLIPCYHISHTRVTAFLLQRLRTLGLKTVKGYIEYIEAHHEEASLLVKRIVLKQCSLRINSKSMRILQDKIIPHLFESPGHDKNIRVWVPSCSTGEEALAIGILFNEHLKSIDTTRSFRIIASENDKEILDFARAPRYATTSLQSIPASIREQYFRASFGSYEFDPDVFDHIYHSELSTSELPPYTEIDLIYCDGLLRTLTPQARDTALKHFYQSLSPKGVLVLGESDTPSDNNVLPYFGKSIINGTVYRRKQSTVVKVKTAPPPHNQPEVSSPFPISGGDGHHKNGVLFHTPRISPDPSSAERSSPEEEQGLDNTPLVHPETDAPSTKQLPTDQADVHQEEPSQAQQAPPIEVDGSTLDQVPDTPIQSDVSSDEHTVAEALTTSKPIVELNALQDLHREMILQAHTHVSLIIRSNFNIVDQIGSIRRFIEWPNDGKTANLLQSFPKAVRADLRIAVSQALRTKKALKSKPIPTSHEGVLSEFRLNVYPVVLPDSVETYAQIVFLDQETKPTAKKPNEKSPSDSEKVLTKLKEELKQTREQLAVSNSLLKQVKAENKERVSKTVDAESKDPAILFPNAPSLSAEDAAEASTQESKLAQQNEELRSTNIELLALNRDLVRRVEQFRKKMKDATAAAGPQTGSASGASTANENQLAGLILPNRHEIRTSLTSIIGFADLLMNRVVDKDNKELAKYISNGGHRLSEYLDPFLSQESETAEYKPSIEHIEPDNTLSFSERLLVVEDSEATRRLLSLVLSDRFDCVVAADAEEAIEMAEKELFKAVLLDINLGKGPSGVDVLEHLRTKKNEYRRIPFMAVTALASPQDRSMLLNKGFDAYLSKPFQRMQLLSSIDRMIERKAAA